MTDFVLEQVRKMEDKETTYLKIFNYAKFLKQPLKLEMFVPCDNQGNILKEPKKDNFLTQSGLYQTDYHTESLKQYEQAKEKVLFEGFTYNSEDELIEKIETDGTIWSIDIDDIVKYTIEDMVQCDLQLTQNAIKQFM